MQELPSLYGLPPELNTSSLVWLNTAAGIFPMHICHCLGGNSFFKCGWSEFVRRLGIPPGDVVCLEYLGSSNFRVFSFALPFYVLCNCSDIVNVEPPSAVNLLDIPLYFSGDV